ncbi:MAG: crotonase/enoyl-CoA hydratase family protein [Deltaproteobacteria bacterium]|nr:crotonase/enoyl-CoA hydratase family protein [Deltaproteobacteria bacterium]
MSERVTISISDGVADVRMNRPDKLNAVDPGMFEGLTKAGLELFENRSASFQAMADSSRERPAVNINEPDSSSPANFAQRAAYIWTELPVPVIAAVHGFAYGAGLQIAMATDIRYIAPDAKMSVMEIRWGLIPDVSGTQTLRHLVPLDVVKELTFTGRIISGTEAKELGLATHVSDNPYESAMALAREIATKSPDAVRAGKKLLNASRLVSLEEGLRMEAELQRSLIGKANQVEAVQANLQKRAPSFKDPA